MGIKETIESKLQALQPEYLEVINESHNHNVPPGSESHFKVIIVTNEFQGKMLVARHRKINDILADELAQSIHALVLHTMTMEEWVKKGGKSNASPPCLGGSASESNKS
ncbi:MAG: BolA/IbaG family iron-sulfur metabolism protein [Nitrosomonas sp.]|nr:BolA/IbaG family iron-sulfur metabolism protein [Nitrosomonas sp.]